MNTKKQRRGVWWLCDAARAADVAEVRRQVMMGVSIFGRKGRDGGRGCQPLVAALDLPPPQAENVLRVMLEACGEADAVLWESVRFPDSAQGMLVRAAVGMSSEEGRGRAAVRAARLGCVGMIDILVSGGVSAEHLMEALAVAVRHQRGETVAWLLEHGCPVDAFVRVAVQASAGGDVAVARKIMALYDRQVMRDVAGARDALVQADEPRRRRAM